VCADEKTPVSSDFYDFSGRKITSPEKGTPFVEKVVSRVGTSVIYKRIKR
jgi:hypothetical protein